MPNIALNQCELINRSVCERVQRGSAEARAQMHQISYSFFMKMHSVKPRVFRKRGVTFGVTLNEPPPVLSALCCIVHIHHLILM